MIYRHVLNHRAEDYLKLGWCYAPIYRLTVHDQWSRLMQWLCVCRIKEPVK